MTLSKVKRNMPTKVIGLVFIALFCNLVINAQNIFHRTYPSKIGKEILSIAATQLSDGNYVSVEMELDSTDIDKLVYSDTIIVTGYKPKGDVLWTQKIYVDEAFQGFTRAHGSVVQGDNDTIYFSLNVDVKDKFNKLIGSVTNGGRFVKVRSFSANADGGDGNEAGHYITNYNNSLFTTYTAIDTNINMVALARRSYDGQNIWSKLLKPESQDVLHVTDINVTVDTTIAIVGGIDSGFYYTVLDTFGTVQWSRKFHLDSINMVAANVKTLSLTDSTFVFSLNNQVDNSSHLISAGRDGSILWAKKLVMTNLDSSLIVDIALDSNNDIIVGGLSFLSTDTSFKFVAKLSAEGNTLWKFGFPGVKADYNSYGSVFSTTDGGCAFVNSAIEMDKLRPSFIKLNSTGVLKFDSIPSCNSLLMEEIFSDIVYKSDTLVWTAKNRGVQDTVAFDFSTNVYEIPKLELVAKKFCPKEPIDWLFDAKTRGAVAVDYAWSTDTNRGLDTLRVFEEGEYSVTVTVGKGVCYMLCDTVKLERYDEPQVQIGLSLVNFCTNGKQTLSLGYDPGHPNIKSINWSTNETGVRSIEILQPGTYTVTVVDECGEVATAEIKVGEFPRKITAATISPNLNVDCSIGEVTGTLSVSGNSFGIGAETYVWSTGQKSREIAVNASTTLTYNVTVTDGCGATAVATFTQALKGTGITDLKITVNRERVCVEKILGLNAVTNKAGNYTYLWSTGATVPNISFTDPGQYVVTVTDVCGNTATASKDIREIDFKSDNKIVNLRINSGNRNDCSGIFVRADFDNEENVIKSYLWSTGNLGDTTRVINFSGKANYTVTVTDICDNTSVASAELDVPDIDYANVFFPDGIGATFTLKTKKDTMDKAAHVLNRSFGPIDIPSYCLDQITNYEFYIFNRWGQQVFDTKDKAKEWDGYDGDRKWQSDTYVWVVKYNIYGFPKTQKGDVTLIR